MVVEIFDRLRGCFLPGEPVPRSLEGLFVYEERSPSPPANDTIVVEQWTVIEVSEGFWRALARAQPSKAFRRM